VDVDRYLPSIIVGALFVLAIAGMYLGWRARARRDSGHTALPAMPEKTGAVRYEASGLYVATTLLEQPLERVALRGLGFRSRASVRVYREGIALELTGQEPVFLSRERILSVQRATWTIDKAVEAGGLVVISWRLGDRDVDTYVRFDGDTEAFLAATDELEGIA
jgi:hypothetical protein